jgi:integrase
MLRPTKKLRPLTERQIHTAPPGRYYFGQGLVLIVKGKHRRRWAFRYTSPHTRRVTETSIGDAHDWTTWEAYFQVHELRKLVRQGLDTVQVKRQERTSGKTFGQVCEEWIKLQQSGWSASQIKNVTLQLRVPLTGKSIAHIDADAIEEAIKPLSPKQARRTVATLARVFDYAKHKKYFAGDNPAEWKGNMEFRLPRQSTTTEHYPHLEYEQMPQFIQQLRAHQARSIAAAAIEFQILTATRPGETLGAQWSEFDLDARVWTIPASRMKNKKEHRVPLSDRAIVLLRRQQEYRSNSPFVFNGTHRTKMDDKAMRVILKGIDRRARDGRRVTSHGFRSSFRTWADEKTEHSYDICELCVSHQVGTAVARSYIRGDALEKRRVVMDQWAAYCCSGEPNKSSE